MTAGEMLHDLIADELGGDPARATVVMDLIAAHRSLAAEWLLSTPVTGNAR